MTEGYRELQRVTEKDREIQRVTESYRELQRGSVQDSVEVSK